MNLVRFAALCSLYCLEYLSSSMQAVMPIHLYRDRIAQMAGHHLAILDLSEFQLFQASCDQRFILPQDSSSLKALCLSFQSSL